MKYLIEIDEKKHLEKSALSILKDIAKKESGITIRKSTINEFDSDTKMVKRMLRARKNGFVNTEEFLNKLKSQL
jgi:hypothetical protein